MVEKKDACKNCMDDIIMLISLYIIFRLISAVRFFWALLGAPLLMWFWAFDYFFVFHYATHTLVLFSRCAVLCCAMITYMGVNLDHTCEWTMCTGAPVSEYIARFCWKEKCEQTLLLFGWFVSLRLLLIYEDDLQLTLWNLTQSFDNDWHYCTVDNV